LRTILKNVKFNALRVGAHSTFGKPKCYSGLHTLKKYVKIAVYRDERDGDDYFTPPPQHF